MPAWPGRSKRQETTLCDRFPRARFRITAYSSKLQRVQVALLYKLKEQTLDEPSFSNIERLRSSHPKLRALSHGPKHTNVRRPAHRRVGRYVVSS